MAITPSGSPAWTRTADHTQYGGNVNKTDFMSIGSINAKTDVSAAEYCRAASDLAAAARTAPMWVITYLNNDSSPAAPTVEIALGMTGVSLVSYAGGSPPAGFPSAARNGNGDVTFTFASSYNDEYGVAGGFSVLSALASVQGTAHRSPTTTTTATTVRVRVFDDAGAAVQNARVSLTVT